MKLSLSLLTGNVFRRQGNKMDHQLADAIQGVTGKGPKRKKTRVLFGFKDFPSRKRLYTFRTPVVAFSYVKLARSGM